MTGELSAAKGVADGINVWCEYSALVPVEKLTQHPQNPNKHPKEQLEALADVIRGNGWRQSIKVSNRSGFIVSGNGRYLCARDYLKVNEVPVDYQDYPDEASELNDLLADNHLSELAEVDDTGIESIRKKINSLGAPDLTGYASALDSVKEQLNNMSGDKIAEPAVPPTAADVKTKPGDLIVFDGVHRLICGDSTDPEVVKQLFESRTCDMLLTDPPYGVDYADKNKFLNRIGKGGGKRREDDIINDKEIDMLSFSKAFLSLIPWSDYNTHYIFMGNRKFHELRRAVEELKDGHNGDILVWVKNQPVLGRTDYLSQFELITYGWFGHHKFYGTRCSSVLNFDRVAKCDLHPTTKPVPLMEKLVEDGCPEAGTVYDSFAGSGSSLLASHMRHRSWLGVELKPEFCDVIVKRYLSSFAGSTAVVFRDGNPVDVDWTH